VEHAGFRTGADADILAAIRAGDILLHQPCDSFYAGVERFIREAADDPQTVSIKMTVYRVGDDTPFVQSLIRAAEAGKQVACVIELNARFVEAREIRSRRPRHYRSYTFCESSSLKVFVKT
jgi:polyphosphate kinase